MGNGCSQRSNMRAWTAMLSVVLAACYTSPVAAQRIGPSSRPTKESSPSETAAAIRSEVSLSSEQWNRLNTSVDRGLLFLATQQQSDGSFSAPDVAQPAVTSFCVMAFLSRGHMPGHGPHGDTISRAIDYTLRTQKPNGHLYAAGAGGEEWKIMGNYNHAIAGVMLGEVYGMTESGQKEAVREAIVKALEHSRREQTEPKRYPDDSGGFRYLLESGVQDSDLSLTAWHLMFYRSARNAEFDVPQEHMEEAIAFVRRCFDQRQGTFCYGLRGRGRGFFGRSMAGAGIVSLALGGDHRNEMARTAGKYLLQHPFDRFNRGGLAPEDRFYYGAFYCSQAMFQLGGDYWEQFFPVLLETLVENQRSDGSWDREANQDGPVGYAYSTSLAILSLTPPYQLLPIYQR